MNIKQPQIPGVYLYAVSECMNDFGIDPIRWLRGSGFSEIDASFIESSIDYNVFHNLVIRAVELSNNPAIGISVGHQLSLQSHGILGYALMNCENLIAAVKLVEQYIALRMPLIQISSHFEGGHFFLQLEEKTPLNDLRTMIFDGVLVAIKSALDQLMPNLKKDLCIYFPYGKHKNIPYGSISDSKLKFNQPMAAISIAKDYMEKPIPLANLSAYKEAELLCAKELQSLSQESAYKSRVKQKLYENTEHLPSQTVMASWFNMTSRTLHRRLVKEGTSYREILEEVKQSLAVSYLSNTNMTIKEIAYFLGYEDDRNFSRAFRRWQGLSPTEYRLTI